MNRIWREIDRTRLRPLTLSVLVPQNRIITGRVTAAGAGAGAAVLTATPRVGLSSAALAVPMGVILSASTFSTAKHLAATALIRAVLPQPD